MTDIEEKSYRKEKSIVNIVIGLTEDDIDALSIIKGIINGCIAEDNFPNEMSEEGYDDWLNMSNVINKICYVIENQTEIEKTAAGMPPVAACKNCSILDDELKKVNRIDVPVNFNKEMLALFEGLEIPKEMVIDTGQNYKICQ